MHQYRTVSLQSLRRKKNHAILLYIAHNRSIDTLATEFSSRLDRFNPEEDLQMPLNWRS